MRERATTGASLGVLGMQERATLLGGQLDIQSQPGQGSVVELRCPWRTQGEVL
jgi:signal transduction histidine kinase